VAILLPPNSKVPSNVLLGEWARQVAQECGGPSRTSNYDPTAYGVKGRAAIDKRGVLQIPWPDCSTTDVPLDGFDVLLGTATKPTRDPTTGDFPTALDIATAWNTQGDASYFHSNREIAALLHV
jgi:hypothetical protein